MAGGGVIRPEDDPRRFWIFTPEGCDHPIGVLTDAGYGRAKAYREMYGGIKPANAAIDRGVQARLIEAREFHQRYAEQLTRGCTCLS